MTEKILRTCINFEERLLFVFFVISVFSCCCRCCWLLLVVGHPLALPLKVIFGNDKKRKYKLEVGNFQGRRRATQGLAPSTCFFETF